MAKILIVEDNMKNRKLLRDLLQFYSHEIFEAENGAQGITMAAEHLPALILMDIQMPVMDGFAAVRLLKENPATRGIKIIAVTSFAMVGDREKIMAAGADEYIAKPIDIKTLPKLVAKMLQGE